MEYYYDDSSWFDHWHYKKFSSDEEAIEWGEKLQKIHKEKPAILYDENFRTLKEWKEV